jgi:hypothetical protein
MTWMSSTRSTVASTTRADQNERDYESFVRALRSGRLDPRIRG